MSSIEDCGETLPKSCSVSHVSLPWILQISCKLRGASCLTTMPRGQEKPFRPGFTLGLASLNQEAPVFEDSSGCRKLVDSRGLRWRRHLQLAASG